MRHETCTISINDIYSTTNDMMGLIENMILREKNDECPNHTEISEYQHTLYVLSYLSGTSRACEHGHPCRDKIRTAVHILENKILPCIHDDCERQAVLWLIFLVRMRL